MSPHSTPFAPDKGVFQLDCDILILGGGPAGSATALALRKHAPTLSTMLVEASSYDQSRIGEVLPAVAGDLLDYLGIRQAFEREKHPPVYATVSVWGNSDPQANHTLFSYYGPGWHLDRRKFDAFLAGRAADNGSTVLLNTQLKTFEKTEPGWSVRLSDDSTRNVRFIVDATGRRAFFAKKMGAKTIAADRLVSFARYFTLDPLSAPETLVESFADGWWYSARAGNKRIVACLTDADIALELGLTDKARWLRLFSDTDQIKKRIGNGVLKEETITCAANSVRLTSVSETGWLAVGDATSAFDPLSAQGITKSLRSAVFASYAITDLLVRADPLAGRRYQKFIETEFAVYQKLYRKHYANECRWNKNAFWQRRQNSGESLF